MKPSTQGEGHERRYFYGTVWAVSLAQPVLFLVALILPVGIYFAQPTALLPVPPESFLRLPVVMETMLPHSSRARRQQLAYLRSREDDDALARRARG